jgi:large subunit ribosomal protein L23
MATIIIKPLVTEKNTSKSAVNTYVFSVAKDATKGEVRTAIEAKYNVKVVSVNTINVLGKAISRYTRTSVVTGRKTSYKKAYVTLAADNFIDIFGEKA